MPENQRCNECNGETVQTVSDNVCNSCGLVLSPVFVEPQLSQNVNEGSDSSSFGSSQGFRLHIADNLGSFMGKYGTKYLRDCNGHSLRSFQSKKYAHLKKLNDIYLHATPEQKRKYRALRILNEASGTLELPKNIQLKACYLLRKTMNSSMIKANIPELIAASLYLSARVLKYIISLKDIIKTFEQQFNSIDGKKILKTAVQIRMLTGQTIRTIRAEDYVNKAVETLCSSAKVKNSCNKRNISIDFFRSELINKTRFLLKEFPSMERGGRNPYVFVCAVLIAAEKLIAWENERPTILTQRLVAQDCQIAEYTLREHYLQLVKPRFIKDSIIYSKK